MHIGTNTFGLGRALAEDLDGTLSRLGQAGIGSIEPCILYSKAVPVIGKSVAAGYQKAVGGAVFCDGEIPGKLALLRQWGFECRSVHVMGFNLAHGGLRRILPELTALARDHGIRYFVFSLSISRIAQAKKWVEELREAAMALRQAGAWLLMHNHDAELKDDRGENVLGYLLRELPALGLELDLGWAQYAGRSCLELMERYGTRIRLLHFKDYLPCEPGEKPVFVAIGQGVLPLEQILARRHRLPNLDALGLIIDQDSSRGDIVEDVQTGVTHIQKSGADQQ